VSFVQYSVFQYWHGLLEPLLPSATNSTAAEVLINHAIVLLVAEGVIRPVFSVSALTGRMTPPATNSRAAEVLITHPSAETLNTGRMTPSATNSTAAEVLINHASAETPNTGRMTP
jgi:hypothetical protein